MTSHLISFIDENGSIRYQMHEELPWFVGKDVCESLDIANHNDTLSSLPGHYKRGSVIPTPGGKQEMTMINQSGLFQLVFRSRKPEAQKFQDWVCDTVLPSIFRTGGYQLTTKYGTLPALIDEAAKVLGTRKALANHVGTSASTLRAICNGHESHPVSNELVNKIRLACAQVINNGGSYYNTDTVEMLMGIDDDGLRIKLYEKLKSGELV